MTIRKNNLFKILLTSIGYFILSLGFVNAGLQTGTDHLNIDVTVKLTTNLLGHITRVSTPGNEYITGGIRYINNQNIIVNIGAITASGIISEYSVTGNILPVGTGTRTGSYSFNQSGILQSGEGLKNLYADYETLWGIYHTGVVRTFLDQTGPTKPQINFTNGIIVQNIFNINWTGGNVDTGVGFHDYILHIALDPGFISEILIPISGSSTSFSTNSLPLGTMRWYLESLDYLGNATPSTTFYFHNELPSYSIPGGIYVPTILTPNYTPLPHNSPDIQYIITTTYFPNKKMLTGFNTIKEKLLHQFAESKASLYWLLPIVSPKTGVDVEEYVKDANDYIWKITNTPIQSPLRYQITLILILIFIGLYRIKENYRNKHHYFK